MNRPHKKSRETNWGPWSAWTWSEQLGKFSRTRDDGRGKSEYQYGQTRSNLAASQASDQPRYPQQDRVPNLSPDQEEPEQDPVNSGAGSSRPSGWNPVPGSGQIQYSNNRTPVVGYPPAQDASSGYDGQLGGSSDMRESPAAYRLSSGQGEPSSAYRTSGSYRDNSAGSFQRDFGNMSINSPGPSTNYEEDRNSSSRQDDYEWNEDDEEEYEEENETYEEDLDPTPTNELEQKQTKPAVEDRYKRVIKTIEPQLEQEPLKPTFRRHESKEFKRGRVFKILWIEPFGDNGLTTNIHTTSIHTEDRTLLLPVKYKDEKAYSSIRRFVVAKAIEGHAICVPIFTYSGRGTGKPGVKPNYHAMIYTGSKPPKYLPGEPKLNNKPIRMKGISSKDKLDGASRLNYSKYYTVEHNVKVLFVGSIHESSLKTFLSDFKTIFNEEI